MAQRTAPDLSAYAVDLGIRHRPGFVVSVQLCTWELVVFRVDASSGGQTFYVAKVHDDVPGFLRRVDAGRVDTELLRALRRPPRRRLVRRPQPSRRLRMGVEHEYVVRDGTQVLDFRAVVSTLQLGVRADPTDPHAQRCSWGGVVTADGREAEVATPPVTVQPGAPAQVAALAEVGHTSLAAALGSRVTLEGYSTHLNVSASPRGDRSLARRFATVFAPSLMLLLDHTGSPGLLVRPRPGRLELGGDHAAGLDLEVALTFALGGALACRPFAWQRARRLSVEVTLEAAVERYGWYVDRRAFGADLYGLGRETPLRRTHPGGKISSATVSAGQHLDDTWRVARASLAGRLAEDELAKVDAVVGGSAPLPRPQEGVAS